MLRALSLVALVTGAFGQTPRDLRIDPLPPESSGESETRWAVVIGISRYRFLPPAAQLHFAHRDAERFAAFLRTAEGGGLPARHVQLLTNEQATLAGVRAALHTWLVQSVKPGDIVYFFVAGHAVLDENEEGYFVAHDSDPQNLHATGRSFGEVDRVLSERLRAGLVVLVADACHTGRWGWSSYEPQSLSQSVEPLSRIGRIDRSFLKLLASSPGERSFEDSAWGGGHGVFTYSLLEGLSGEADRDGDRAVRVSEAIDYISRRVPERTESLQHPRVAGTFNAQTALAQLPPQTTATAHPALLELSGPASTAVYIDSTFRGRIRATGTLRVESLTRGRHHLSADFPDGSAMEGTFSIESVPPYHRIPGVIAARASSAVDTAGAGSKPQRRVGFLPRPVVPGRRAQ
jgi:uncharacterized caspase-like protein